MPSAALAWLLERHRDGLSFRTGGVTEQPQPPCCAVPIYAWHVFAGPSRDGETDFSTRCEATGGFGRDIDIARGGPLHDLNDDGVFAELLKEARFAAGLRILGGPPCRTFSVARMRQTVEPQSLSCHRLGTTEPMRFAQSAPRQLRSDEYPEGMPDLSPYERALVAADTLLVERLLNIAGAAYAGGGSFVIENPVGRHDGPHAREQWRGHAPLWALPAVRDFAAGRNVIFVDFPMCALGCPYEKLTTVMLSPDLAWLASKLRALTCPHGRGGHEEIAVGFDSNGKAVSAAAAAYPPRFADLVFEGFRRAAVGAAISLPVPIVVPTVALTRAGTYSVAIPFIRYGDTLVVGLPLETGRLFGSWSPAGLAVPSRDDSLHSAEDLLRTILQQPEAMADLAAMREVQTDDGIATIRIHFAGAVPPPDAGYLWRPSGPPCRWAVTSSAPAGLPSEVAFAVHLAVRDRLEPGPELPPELMTGVGGPMHVASDMRDATRPAVFAERLERSLASERALVEALRAAEGPAPMLRFLSQCADRVSPPNVGELPEALRSLSREADDPALADLPFASRCVIDRERPPPTRLPPAAPFPEGVPHHSDTDIFEPWFIESFTAYMARYNAYHVARTQGLPARRPGVFAADETAVKPPFRGMFIDLRGGTGHIKPMDPNALALDPHIDSSAMYEELSSVGDMEIADLWAHGVTFKADMPNGWSSIRTSSTSMTISPLPLTSSTSFEQPAGCVASTTTCQPPCGVSFPPSLSSPSREGRSRRRRGRGRASL